GGVGPHVRPAVRARHDGAGQPARLARQRRRVRADDGDARTRHQRQLLPQHPFERTESSTCAYPTFVIATMVGSITSRSRAISPGTLAPASTTSASASSGAPRIVSGTPTRLFRLPLVACTRYRVARTARIISLALVLPLEPLI